MKPLYRWTIGDVSKKGLEVFEYAVRFTQRALKNNFDYAVCSNAIDPNAILSIKKISNKYGLHLHESDWQEFPLPPEIIPIENYSKSPIGIPRGRQGSFWKMCPARLRIESHEIIADNDLIVCNMTNHFEEFLNSKKTLVLQEDARNLGKYGHLFGENETFNSGLMGLPPGYDFADEIKKRWIETGSFCPLLSRDEQGLLTYTLKMHPHIVVNNKSLLNLFSEGLAKKFIYEEIKENGTHTLAIIKVEDFYPINFYSFQTGYHFLNINRFPSHKMWEVFKNQTIMD
jgi:hypothetical protein